MRDPQTVLLTGASSGLGKALALAYAAPGVTLFLSGRDGERLEQTAQEARSLGTEAYTQKIDVTDSAAMRRWIEECERAAPLDLVIANAGISAGTGKNDETAAQAAALFAVNIGGVMNTLFPALSCMKRRGRGQIALMSSLAGLRGLRGAPAYCASKAAVRIYGEALRGEAEAQGIEVNVICPGFVQTPMTDVNPFPMPFLMTAEKAARIIQKGLSRNKARIAFPLPMAMAAWTLSLLPACVVDAITRRLPRKP